jgi:hypothetical protein
VFGGISDSVKLQSDGYSKSNPYIGFEYEMKDPFSESNLLSSSCDSLLASSITVLELSKVKLKDETGK